MATATRKTAHALDGVATQAEATPVTGTLQFQIYQENSGRHRWRLTTSDGLALATSNESFMSRDDAQRSVDENSR
jgi:uncharacterized protein YegP (UPF0339 family)